MRQSLACSFRFSISRDSAGTWTAVVIPRCPVNGNVVDAQLAIGASGRLYASYMDGNAKYTPIVTIYSDDHGSTWSQPVDVTNGGKGDKDMLLVDQNNYLMVACENGGKQYVSVSTNGGTSFTSKPMTVAPSGVALATGAVLDTKGNAYFAWSATNNTGKGPTIFYLLHSSNLFATSCVTTIDEGEGEPIVSGAGWDYGGGSVQIGVQPKTAPANDRLIAIYNAGAGSNGAPERIYTKYSDTLGASWNIPFNSSSWPNGSQLSWRRAAYGTDFRRSRARREEQLTTAVEANVRWSIHQILETEEGQNAMKAGFRLMGAVYEIASGRVRFLS